MGAFISLLVVVTSLTSASPPTEAAMLATIERGVFATPLAAFGGFERTAQRHFPQLDWTTDHCSSPLVGNTGRSFDFTLSCRRHDFGYRNLKLLQRLTSGNYWNDSWRRRVDEQFRKDMHSTCAVRRFTQRYTCGTWAEIFYRTVRTWGD